MMFRRPSHAPTTPSEGLLASPRGRPSPAGQSLVELALILPLLVGFAGGATDLARAYQAQITLESAVRNAAEYVAANSSDGSAAATDARRVVCLETRDVPGFKAGPGPNGIETCVAPAVAVATFRVSATEPGGTTKNPMGTARIAASLGFQTLVPYPFLPAGFTLSADSSFTVVRGR